MFQYKSILCIYIWVNLVSYSYSKWRKRAHLKNYTLEKRRRVNFSHQKAKLKLFIWINFSISTFYRSWYCYSGVKLDGKNNSVWHICGTCLAFPTVPRTFALFNRGIRQCSWGHHKHAHIDFCGHWTRSFQQ